MIEHEPYLFRLMLRVNMSRLRARAPGSHHGGLGLLEEISAIGFRLT